MIQYIPKSDVVAEIKRRIKTLDEILSRHPISWPTLEKLIEENKKVLSFLDTLEVKEVDLEDSIKETLAQKYINYTFRRHNIDPESKEGQLIYYAYMHGMNQCLTQLRIQKE